MAYAGESNVKIFSRVPSFITANQVRDSFSYSTATNLRPCTAFGFGGLFRRGLWSGGRRFRKSSGMAIAHSLINRAFLR